MTFRFRDFFDTLKGEMNHHLSFQRLSQRRIAAHPPEKESERNDVLNHPLLYKLHC